MHRRKYADLTGVRLGKAMIDRLDALGAVLGRSRSELIREGIALLFQRYGLLRFGEKEETGNQ